MSCLESYPAPDPCHGISTVAAIIDQDLHPQKARDVPLDGILSKSKDVRITPLKCVWSVLDSLSSQRQSFLSIPIGTQHVTDNTTLAKLKVYHMHGIAVHTLQCMHQTLYSYAIKNVSIGTKLDPLAFVFSRLEIQRSSDAFNKIKV